MWASAPTEQNMIKTRFNGKDIFLYFSGQAMFELDEIRAAWNDGHVQDEAVLGVAEIIMKLDAERLDVLFRSAEILERAALSARRALHQEEFAPIPAEELAALAKPRDVVGLQEAVMRTIADGYKTDAEHNEPVDLFMLENQKKKTSQKARRRT